MDKMAKGSELARPRHIQNTPPIVCSIHRFHSLPLIPNLLAAISDIRPPKGRAAIFAIPKVAAIIPAV